MWRCQIFLRLGGKNAAARVAVQAAVYGLSYCYGAFYTIVLFRQPGERHPGARFL